MCPTQYSLRPRPDLDLRHRHDREKGVVVSGVSCDSESSRTGAAAAQLSPVATADAAPWIAGGVRVAMMMGLSLALAFMVMV